jgi:hypothetical protein
MPHIRSSNSLAEGIFSGFSYIRQQSQMAGALDGVCQLTLVASAGPCLTTRANFALFGYKAAKHINGFVIDFDIFVGAELAYFRSSYIPAANRRLRIHIHIIGHTFFSDQKGNSSST